MRALISGFGSFEGVEENPTERLVTRLLAAPPADWELSGSVLPVSFARAPSAWDALLAREAAADVLVALGVSGRDGFQLEAAARARPLPTRHRTDNDGQVVGAVEPSSPDDLTTDLDLADLVARVATRSGQPVTVSSDAGAYVCERTYHHLLVRARERSVPALFVHVPTFERIALPDQLSFLHALFAELFAPR
ncbi:MAG: hypothetical protein WD226_12430 [Planctomycetota bacterium]